MWSIDPNPSIHPNTPVKLTMMPPGLAIETRRFASLNPATGEVLGEFDCASVEEVQACVARARASQPAWWDLGVLRRRQILRQFQRLLHERKTEVARLVTEEAGKPYAESLVAELMVVLDAARFCSETAYAFLRPQPVPHGNLIMKAKAGFLLREPHGVIGIISPWNYPLSTPASETLAALVTGNAVVLKPSELTPLVALKLEELLHAAGVPRDIFQVAVGDGATGSALVDSAVDKIVFTGSVKTGRRIAQAVASRFLPLVLELGGKDPAIILEDTDLDTASSGVVWGAFMNAGQTCLSIERCYVHRSVHDRFVEACVTKARRLRIGNGSDPKTEIGPMIHERQLQTVETHVQDAVAHGAQVLCGGARLPELGPNFYAPTVLTGVTHEMRIMAEETFGPVLPIMPFDTEEEAIRLANHSVYGLAASVWTSNRARGEFIARRLRAGTVMVNDSISAFAISEAPHGGLMDSGIGRTHGRLGMEEMVRVKYLDKDRIPAMKRLWWYGYGPAFSAQMEGFLDFLFGRSLIRRLRGGLRSLGAVKRKSQI
jgi:acyl-CoA reductase-like NAD-dependent aldehyde dehydrogenase